jgi:hypothetical protein
MRRARLRYCILPALLLVLTSACEGLGNEPPKIYANQIQIDYPDGMTVANGSSIEITVENLSLYCLQFPVDGAIPIYVYVGNGSVQVRNDMAYAWSAIKMSPLNTTSARRRFEIAPYLDPHDKTFNLPLYSAYIPLEGFICDNPAVTVTKKIPFFIQYYTDY